MAKQVFIKGAKWRYKAISLEQYVNLHGEKEWAHRDCETKTMTFCYGKMDLGLMRHEVFHCFMSECCLNSLPECDPLVVEEIAAEVLQNHWDDIDLSAKKILKDIQ